jgi:flagellar biosynthesis protein FliQ
MNWTVVERLIDVVLLVLIWTIIIAFVVAFLTGCANLHALAGEFLPKIQFVEVVPPFN